MLRHQIAKSDEKVEAMMMMMLHYCAGLQYCLDQEQEEKQRRAGTKSSSASYDKQPVEEIKSSESNSPKSLIREENQISCPAISVEVASSPEENVEDFALFPEREDDVVHVGVVDDLMQVEDASHLMQDPSRSDRKQEEETLKATNMEGKHRLLSSYNDQSTSFKQPEVYMDEEDILADVINTVTEIIEKSEGETDSSDSEDAAQVDETHSIN